MKRYFSLVFAPLFASCGCFVAFDYFATPSLHGIINGEILLFLAIWMLPRTSKFKIILALLGIVVFFFFNPIIGGCAFFSIVVSSVRRKSKLVSILPAIAFFVFSIVSDCAALFRDSFMMSLPQFWRACSFFWWGAILFFVVPLGYAFATLWFSRRILWPTNGFTLSIVSVITIILTTLFVNEIFTFSQNRMLLIDFPIYRNFSEYNVFKNFDAKSIKKEPIKAETLSDDVKRIFEIWNERNNILMKKKAVYILMESYGVHKDTSIAKHMIFTPFRESNVTFSGLLARSSMFTQGAELEDLGHVDYHDSSEISFISSLKKSDAETWFLHGYVGSFYSRNEKYRQFGFDSLLFINDLKKRNLKICNYGFEGICDFSMIDLIDTILQTPGDKFIFWTTLDSHPPYSDNLDLPSYSVFCKNTTVSEKMCMYLSLIENTLKNVARLAKKHPDYQFVIRGDHRPMGTINPNDFYYAWVPMIILN